MRLRLLVPGLKDNTSRDVRRGRYRLTGADVMTIFDPVVKEVVSLVLGQIDATREAVKAVLLVGGFGQNTFLRDSIRQAVTSKGIEVMQSPNG
jgi:tRNA A37 threonylcarbamoyltransferase TsaD